MRAALIALLATVITLPAASARCGHHSIRELAEQSFCGRSEVLWKCLGEDANLDNADEVQICFIKAGCAKENARAEASWLMERCRLFEKAVQGELRRRDDSDNSSNDDDSNTSDAAASTTTAGAATTTAPSSTEATTTNDLTSTLATSSSSMPTTTTASSISSVNTVSSTTASMTTSSSSSTTTTTGTNTCSTTSFITTSYCTTNAGGLSTCSPAVATSISCAPGMLCASDPATGAGVCRKLDNRFSIAGIVMTATFGSGILGFIIAAIVMAVRARTTNKRVQDERIAALSQYSKPVDVEAVESFAHANRSEASIPLVAPISRAGTQREYPQTSEQQGYFEQSRRGAPPVPRIPSYLGRPI